MPTRLLWLALLFGCTTTLLAQRPPGAGGGGFGRSQGPQVTGRIQGTIIDSLSGQPVDFATIVLYNAKNEQIDGTVTEEGGTFRLTEVKTGTYRLEISFLGYETKTVTAVKTTPEKPDVDLRAIFLQPSAVALEAITVEGEAALIENRIDKLVYNAEKDVTSSGGDASDVLRKVPLLSVDLEGNVSLRGSSNIQILVNGRPSSLFASNPAEALKTIPADQIKNIEVITAPSAKYDGEGAAGIINIITKKKSAEGLTGSVNSSIGTRQNNGGVNLNLVRGRFGLNGGANSFWSWRREGENTFFRRDGINSDAETILEQNGANGNRIVGYNGNFGAFYDFNAYNSINTGIRFNGFLRRNDGEINGQLTRLGSSDPAEIFSRINDVRADRTGFDWTTDYKRTYPDSEREFSMAFQISGNQSTSENTVDQEGSLTRFMTDLLNNNDGTNTEYTLQADYVHPFSKKAKLETGLKSVLRRIDSDYSTKQRLNDSGEDFTPVPQLTDLFEYIQDVYAGYLQTNVKIGEKWGVIAGLRYEHTEIAGDYRDLDDSFTQDYDNFLPTLIVQRKLDNFSNLKATYTKRIQRPSLFFINPFTQISDPNNIQEGNPFLDPEIVNQYEISYNTFLKKIKAPINISAYYRQTNDAIESFLQVDEATQVSRQTYLNIGIQRSFGINFFTSVSIGKIWTIRMNANIFTYDAESTVDSIGNLSRSTVQWNGNLGSTFNLPNDWKIEAFGFYRSPRQTLQGENPSFSIFSMGFRKEFSKQFSLGVRAVEPFNEDKLFASELRGDDFEQFSSFSIPFRSIGISIRYSFGKVDFRNRRDRRSIINNNDAKGGEGSNQF